MTDSARPYAVIGATGQQGSAVVDALLKAGAPVRAIVRDPSSDKSKPLADRGVELVKGDQEDTDSMRQALAGVEAAYLMTTFGGPDGVEGETRRGRLAAEAAAAAGVPRMVYSSVGGAERESGVPHFESKRRVEERLQQLLPVTFVRPTYFMDNLTRMMSGDHGSEFVLQMAMPGDVPLEMVAVQDIGKVAAAVLQDPTLVEGEGIEISGDRLTGEETATLIGAHLGLPARYEAAPVDALPDEDLKHMFRWFVDTPAYRGDFEGTRRIDPEVVDLAGWLRTQR